MRKLFILAVILLSVIFFAMIVFVVNASRFSSLLTPDKTIPMMIQLLAAFGTMAAVGWALFGAAIMSRLLQPSLKLTVQKDLSHCCYFEDENQSPDVKVSRVRILGDVANSQQTIAKRSQVVSNELYVSSDGVKFSSIKKFCTASFRWVYAKDFDVDVQRGVEKYVRFLDIVQTCACSVATTGASPDKKNSKRGASAGSDCLTSFELKLPDQGTAGGKCIKVGSDYKGVMFPVRMVGTNFQMQEWYIKVVWLGVDLSKYMEGDKLQVEKLTPEEAHKLMI